MRILLDESAPRIIKTALPHLQISTVQEMGWAGKGNGELLTLSEARFDVFITADKKLRYQQNFAGKTLAVVVIPTNPVPVVTRLLTQIEQAATTVTTGNVVEIPLPLD